MDVSLADFYQLVACLKVNVGEDKILLSLWQEPKAQSMEKVKENKGHGVNKSRLGK